MGGKASNLALFSHHPPFNAYYLCLVNLSLCGRKPSFIFKTQSEKEDNKRCVYEIEKRVEKYKFDKVASSMNVSHDTVISRIISTWPISCEEFVVDIVAKV